MRTFLPIPNSAEPFYGSTGSQKAPITINAVPMISTTPISRTSQSPGRIPPSPCAPGRMAYTTSDLREVTSVREELPLEVKGKFVSDDSIFGEIMTFSPSLARRGQCQIGARSNSERMRQQ